MMPADFVKFQVLHYNPDLLIKNPLLDFEGKHSVSTGEIYNDKGCEATYNFMKFKIQRNNYITVSGSLHKYWNANNGITAPLYQLKKLEDKGFNGNTFGILQLYEVLDDFKNSFEIDMEHTTMLQYEHGLNLQIKHSPTKILRNLFLHHGKQPNGRHNGYYKEFEHYKCSLKVYDKGKQYLMDDNVLRIENHYKGSTILKTKGLFSLHDLTNTNVLKAFNDDLISNWSRVLIYDYTMNKKALTIKEQNQVLSFSNPNYWCNMSPTNRTRSKKKFKQLTQNHSQNIQDDINQQMKIQSALLTQPCELIYTHF